MSELLLLEGFAISELEGQLSPIIKRTYSDRIALKPNLQNIIFTEVRGTKTEPIIVFLSEPTYKFRMPIVPFGKPKKEIPGVAYETSVKLIDFAKWTSKSISEVDIKEFREILKVVEIQVDCQCMAFHWTGIRYQLSQIDAAIYPTNIPDKVWRFRHTQSGVPTLCKHLAGMFKVIRFHAPQLLKAIKDNSKRKKFKKTS